MAGALEHSPSLVIKHLLIDAGLGTDPMVSIGAAWPVYRGREPDRPDDLLKVMDTVGRDFGYSQPDSERQENHGIQVTVRAADYGTGYRRAREVALFLDTVTKERVDIETVGTGSADVAYTIHSVVRTSDIIPLGSDTPGGKRQLFTINALCSIRQCP